MSMHECKPVSFEEGRLRVVRAKGLALEHELGDPADQVFDAGRSVWPQLKCVHDVSVYRLDQELVKPKKEFSEPSHKFLVEDTATPAKAPRPLLRGVPKHTP